MCDYKFASYKSRYDACMPACIITIFVYAVCRECIMKKIDEEEIVSCPVCEVALGITPEEKLR